MFEKRFFRTTMLVHASLPLQTIGLLCKDLIDSPSSSQHWQVKVKLVLLEVTLGRWHWLPPTRPTAKRTFISHPV